MSAFQALADTSFVAIDAVYGEPLLITHRVSGQFVAGAPDSANPPFTAVGVLDVNGVVVDDAGLKTAARSEAVMAKPVADFAFSQFGAGRLQPVAGTILTRTSRPGSPRFEVVSRLPDGVGRVVFQLAAVP